MPKRQPNPLPNHIELQSTDSRALRALFRSLEKQSDSGELSAVSRKELASIPAMAELSKAARQTRRHAQARFSHFRVGAAILCADGSVVQGVNVESASYGLTVCAERSALVSALSQGHTSFLAIAIDADTAQTIQPCGACRQLLSEYCASAIVLLMSSEFPYRLCTMKQLLPFAFDDDALTP